MFPKINVVCETPLYIGSLREVKIRRKSKRSLMIIDKSRTWNIIKYGKQSEVGEQLVGMKMRSLVHLNLFVL